MKGGKKLDQFLIDKGAAKGRKTRKTRKARKTKR
jgi:hypothetical protein